MCPSLRVPHMTLEGVVCTGSTGEGGGAQDRGEELISATLRRIPPALNLLLNCKQKIGCVFNALLNSLPEESVHPPRFHKNALHT